MSGVLHDVPEIQCLYVCREKGYRVKFLVVFFRHLKKIWGYFKLSHDISGLFALPLSINILLIRRFIFSIVGSFFELTIRERGQFITNVTIVVYEEEKTSEHKTLIVA